MLYLCRGTSENWCGYMSTALCRWIYLAIVITIWGVTFASTRAMLVDFSSFEILVLRFALAFGALWGMECVMGVSKCGGMRDEWLFAAMGFTGIVAYQFLENCAIYYTNAINVAIFVSFGPIVTALMASAFTKSRHLSIRVIVGSMISVVGVAFVSLNGVVNFELRPLGDIMALCAMVSWGGGYSILLDVANRCGVPPIVAVRKAFGWSLAMMIPIAVWGMTESGICALDGSFAVVLDPEINLERFTSLINWMNIAFLGLLASAASFVLWSAACKTVGVVRLTISLYLTPIVGVLFAAVFLGERLTVLEIVGGCIILIGVALATKVRGGEA